MSAASAAARAASQVPGPISVIVSKQNAPGRAQVAAGTSGSSGVDQARVREDVRHDPVLAGVVRAARPPPSRCQARGEEGEQRRVVHGLDRRVVVRRRSRRPVPPRRSSASRIASARAGTSVAGVLTPDPDLGLGLVQPVLVRPYERDRESHARDPTAVGSADVSETTLRGHGLRIGHLEPGRANAITDVPGVRSAT